MKSVSLFLVVGISVVASGPARTQPLPVVPKEQRSNIDFERKGFHDAANIRTEFWNFGMVGNYPADPINVDLSVFHSAEVPKGSGMNYSDGITPFVLAEVVDRAGQTIHIMETGFRERQQRSPTRNIEMRFEPRPGYFQSDPDINLAESPAVSNDPRTWPDAWPDKMTDPDDPGWRDSWNGYFGKRPAADQECFMVLDDDHYDAFNYFPDSRDPTRRGLGLRVEVRGFQWANPQSRNVIFWHYDITNESDTDYNENIIFGLYMDSGVGGSAISCDGVAESDDDNAFFDKSFNLNLVYTWDKLGHGRDLSGNCGTTGYLGYAYLETPGKPTDGIDNDDDGVADERRDGGPGQLIVGREAIEAYVNSTYNRADFEGTHGPLAERPAYKAARWWTGDEDMDWIQEVCDTGADGVFAEEIIDEDDGEGDGMPTPGEPNFDRTDLHESDQIGLTGFKLNRIRAGTGNPSTAVDNIVFFDNGNAWPQRLYDQFTAPNEADRFDEALALNYNIGFLFASGPFTLPAGKTERFSLALAYGANLDQLEENVRIVQNIYNANYQFAVPPPLPTLTAETGDGFVRLSWNDVAERSLDPVTGINDFEGYRIYRSTDPDFLDVSLITDARGTETVFNKPLVQFDLVDEIKGFSDLDIFGVKYYLGDDTGLTHTFTDTTVTNGQEYYYAITSYDFGSEQFGYFPSENAIAVTREARATILPSNVVAARANPKVSGYVAATASSAEQISGGGDGTVDVQIVNSEIVPENHIFKLTFKTIFEDSIRAIYYDLFDSTAARRVITNGYDLNGEGIGQVAEGLLPIITTPTTVLVDEEKSGFTASSTTNARLTASYQRVLPVNLLRPGYPDNLTFVFSDVPMDTSLPALGLPAKPAKFQVFANTINGDMQLQFRFRDTDNDGTLSAGRNELYDEYIDVVTYAAGSVTPSATWRVAIDTTALAESRPVQPPRAGDVYQLALLVPFSNDDIFIFSSTSDRIDASKARTEFTEPPYVVPNPYIGSASFEPQRFADTGRGERRIEFRGVPALATVRIYSVRGELVQTLTQDGSSSGIVAWNLRTKDNLDVAPGLYIFHIDGRELGTHIGKFAIVK
jgi:hypothetical protein